MWTTTEESIEQNHVGHGVKQPHRAGQASDDHVTVGTERDGLRFDGLALFLVQNGGLVFAVRRVVRLDGQHGLIAYHQTTVTLAETAGFHELAVAGHSGRGVLKGEGATGLVVGDHATSMHVADVDGAVETGRYVLRPA